MLFKINSLYRNVDLRISRSFQDSVFFYWRRPERGRRTLSTKLPPLAPGSQCFTLVEGGNKKPAMPCGIAGFRVLLGVAGQGLELFWLRARDSNLRILPTFQATRALLQVRHECLSRFLSGPEPIRRRQRRLSGFQGAQNRVSGEPMIRSAPSERRYLGRPHL